MSKHCEKNVQKSKDLWSSSEKNEQIQDMAHWRSVGRWSEKKWLNIGINNYLLFEELCRMRNCSASEFKSMLEWGPGGGSNLYKFSDSFERVYGVDISAASLRECATQLDSKQNTSYELFLIDKDPDIAKTFLKEKIDFFLSVAVFQHFPSQEYGLHVLDCASEMLREDGLAIIQIRYCGKEEDYASKEEDYIKNFVTFTSYEIDEFWNDCVLAGFEPLSVRLVPKTNYAFFYLRRTNKKSFIKRKYKIK